tara:strand:+ start:171 stop:581 length:411 start_codon:yes stop_codon:yes gene_type:complete
MEEEAEVVAKATTPMAELVESVVVLVLAEEEVEKEYMVVATGLVPTAVQVMQTSTFSLPFPLMLVCLVVKAEVEEVVVHLEGLVLQQPLAFLYLKQVKVMGLEVVELLVLRELVEVVMLAVQAAQVATAEEQLVSL